jgi:hypothetical protein
MKRATSAIIDVIDIDNIDNVLILSTTRNYT